MFNYASILTGSQQFESYLILYQVHIIPFYKIICLTKFLVLNICFQTFHIINHAAQSVPAHP